MRARRRWDAAVIDEFFDKLVDDACVEVPRYLKPRVIKWTDSAFGWRICLYVVCLLRWLKNAFRNIRDEEQAETFVREALARGGDQLGELAMLLARGYAWLCRLEERGMKLRFTGLLFLTMLSPLCVLATGSAAAAGCAAAMALFFLAEGMESAYPPVAGGVRQRYLAAMLLRGGGYAALTLSLFRLYASGGLPTNIVLQSAMIVMMFVHAVLFLAFAAFERQQMPVLRVLTGVLGLLPALAGAAALAAAASMMGGAAAAAGVCLAAGAVVLFMMEEARMIFEIGLVQARFAGLVIALMMLLGCALLLCGAWTAALL